MDAGFVEAEFEGQEMIRSERTITGKRPDLSTTIEDLAADIADQFARESTTEDSSYVVTLTVERIENRKS